MLGIAVYNDLSGFWMNNGTLEADKFTIFTISSLNNCKLRVLTFTSYHANLQLAYMNQSECPILLSFHCAFDSMNIVNSQDPSVHATLFCLCHNNVV
jgi:hypothetical protein